MINLDFTTENPRWGKSGMMFKDEKEYSRTLGFLANKRHYRGYGKFETHFDESFIIKIEQNNIDQAWEKECRIYSFKSIENFEKELPAFSRASSTGVGNIKFRINTNVFINYLIEEYNFIISKSESSEYIQIVFPTDSDYIMSIFERKIKKYQYKKQETLIKQFNYGFNL